jgi:hypothetical protein
MRLILDLPEELERELTVNAQREGLSLSEYVIQLLTERGGEPVKTGAKLVDYWEEIGVIGMLGDIDDSQAYARKIRSAAEKRT